MGNSPYKVLCIVGARPNFMKIAPILDAFEKYTSKIKATLLHTGQHYDHAMKTLLFEQLGIPVPDIDLEVQGGSHAEQTANIMLKFEQYLLNNRPDTILVVGDVNSTIACALVAVKLHVPVIHVEAGLRSNDLKMPEEINRLLTDRISQRLYVTEELAIENLKKEGVEEKNIHFVGNVMIDTLLKFKSLAPPLSAVFEQYQVPEASEAIEKAGGKYFFLTMHRPSNVDQEATLKSLLLVINELAEKTPIIFAVHPRTRANVQKFGLNNLLEGAGLFTLPPVGYLDSVALMGEATAVLTDSGGIQEETTALGVPCITMRENTERWITVTEGTNTIVGSDSDKIRNEVSAILAGQGKAGNRPKLWDGAAAQRIVVDIENWLEAKTHVFAK